MRQLRRALPDVVRNIYWQFRKLSLNFMSKGQLLNLFAGSGSLILEMGALSRLTGDRRYEIAALRALRKLWSMRSSLNLLGTTLDVETGEWLEHSSGIGAGMCKVYLLILLPCKTFFFSILNHIGSCLITIDDIFGIIV